MKIINEKGKLFGIINIIDLIVIVVLALLITGGVKRVRTTRPDMVSETKKATVTIEVSEIRNATVEGLVVGDPIYHYDKGNYFGKIVDVKVEPFKEAVESNGKWVNAEVPEKYVATLTVEADAVETPDVIIIGGEQTRIGHQFRLKNKKVAVFGTILGVEVE
ncbi:DUF4330 domain-containing protein [Anaerosalibacter sp. Marseille-P3206]|uniref:DUF4330 domain-containing protein n=1 Tax=Anaerosalibacter sp. Marseille-P3206 TaxID=1871005 RepID=UPI0009877E1F|nr:DUF4330 domain-containing protein [Anaerosalibacter sp. Marseille-P3206]